MRRSDTCFAQDTKTSDDLRKLGHGPCKLPTPRKPLMLHALSTQLHDTRRLTFMPQKKTDRRPSGLVSPRSCSCASFFALFKKNKDLLYYFGAMAREVLQ